MAKNEMTVEEVLKAIGEKIEDKIKNLAKGEELTQLKEELGELTEKMKAINGDGTEENPDKLKELQEAVATLQGKVDSIKEESKTISRKDLATAIYDVIEKKHAKILEISKQKSGSVVLEVKAAGTMTITGNYSGGTVGLSQMEMGVARIQRRRTFMRSIVNSAGTSQTKFVTYVEQKNADPGAAGMTGEGATKTQTDFDLVETSKQVKKITAFIKISKEMLDDLSFIRGEINGELMELIELKLDEQLLLGDGTGDNLEGVDLNAVAFAAGTFAADVKDANNSDVLRVAIAQVTKNNFFPNYLLLNPEDAAKMEMTKDANGQYTYLATVTIDGQTRVKGIPVIENPGITAGNFYVGDFTKANLRIREEMSVEAGHVNDDFIKNLLTILAEMRAVSYVKSNHYGAIVKGNFATAIAAIDKP